MKNMNASAHRQSGAALFVALVLLIVITILAVSTMGTSRLELQMVGNTQFGVNAFQAAQSAIELRISENAFTTAGAPVTRAHEFDDIAADATSTMGYLKSTDVPVGGFSFGAGFQAFHFQIDVEAEAARNAVSEQTQGFYIVGPGGN